MFYVPHSSFEFSLWNGARAALGRVRAERACSPESRRRDGERS